MLAQNVITHKCTYTHACMHTYITYPCSHMYTNNIDTCLEALTLSTFYADLQALNLG